MARVIVASLLLILPLVFAACASRGSDTAGSASPSSSPMRAPISAMQDA